MENFSTCAKNMMLLRFKKSYDNWEDWEDWEDVDLYFNRRATDFVGNLQEILFLTL